MDALALEKAISSAERSLDVWSIWLLLATLVVVIGLVVEYFPDVRKLLAERPLNRMLLVEMVGGVLVTIGLAGELGVQFFQSEAETKLRDSNHQYVALLEHTTEELRAANLALEVIVQPRQLTSEQQKTITSRLRPFAGQRVVITSWALDGEAWLIGQQIGNSLNTAGVELVDKRGNFSTTMGYQFGIDVGGPSVDLVKAIVSALQDDGNLRFVSENEDTAKMVLTGPNIRDVPGAAAAIFIGTKPLPEMK